MPKFNNGKITSSVIFYNRGVTQNQKNFGTVAAMNFSMIKQIARFNKQSGRPNYSLFSLF
jgi:hypothetical protein